MKTRTTGKQQATMAKRFVALARVSSREQEREGFSLDVQFDALQRYSDRAGGQIVKLYRIAETASKTDERKTFKELIAYAKEYSAKIDGLLFYKVDRAARNLFDYVELERLEGEPYHISFMSVSQPTEHTPAGRIRVKALMGEFVYKAHELTYAGEIIRCGRCGYPITGESVIKKQTGKEYIYYRCSKYTHVGHPRIRPTESKLDDQILALFARIKQPDTVAEQFSKMLRLWLQDQQNESRSTADDIQQELTGLRDQQDRLLNLRLLDEIEPATFARKNTELRDRIATLTLQLESAHRRRDERAELAQKVFEISQRLTERWLQQITAKSVRFWK